MKIRAFRIQTLLSPNRNNKNINMSKTPDTLGEDYFFIEIAKKNNDKKTFLDKVKEFFYKKRKLVEIKRKDNK